MPQFFIERPIFAWVVALAITLFGLLALPNMPVAQYPDVAPPSVTIRATYPGATAEDVALGRPGVDAQRGAYARHLVGCHADAGPGPAAHDALVGAPLSLARLGAAGSGALAAAV